MARMRRPPPSRFPATSTTQPRSRPGERGEGRERADFDLSQNAGRFGPRLASHIAQHTFVHTVAHICACTRAAVCKGGEGRTPTRPKAQTRTHGRRPPKAKGAGDTKIPSEPNEQTNGPRAPEPGHRRPPPQARRPPEPRTPDVALHATPAERTTKRKRNGNRRPHERESTNGREGARGARREREGDPKTETKRENTHTPPSDPQRPRENERPVGGAAAHHTPPRRSRRRRNQRERRVRAKPLTAVSDGADH